MTSVHSAQHPTFSRRSAAALAAAVLFLAGCGEEAKTTAADAAAASKATPAQQAPIPVGVVQLVEHEALDATVKGFIDELAARGFKDGENIRIDHQNAQGDQATLANIGTRFVSNKSQLIFAHRRLPCRLWLEQPRRFLSLPLPSRALKPPKS